MRDSHSTIWVFCFQGGGWGMNDRIMDKVKQAWARWGDWNNFVDILDLVGWKTGVGSVLGGMSTYAWIMEPGNRPVAFLCGIGVAILSGIISINYQLRSGGAKKPLRVEFFSTIEDLRPLSETFKPGNEIHAYLLSGDGVFPNHTQYIRSVKRLILPNPNSETVITIGEFSNPRVDYTNQIPKYWEAC